MKDKHWLKRDATPQRCAWLRASPFDLSRRVLQSSSLLCDRKLKLLQRWGRDALVVTVLEKKTVVGNAACTETLDDLC